MSQPSIADAAPAEPFLTGYDMSHLAMYLRLLDANEEGADWWEVAGMVLNLDRCRPCRHVLRGSTIPPG